MNRSAFACLAVALAFSGCSLDGSTRVQQAPTEPTVISEPYIEVAARDDPARSGSPMPSRPAPRVVQPNPDLVASMKCEPLSADLLKRMRLSFGTPDRSVQVKVGEGLKVGETWWVVVLDSPSDDAYAWGFRHFLTSAPGLTEGGAWIYIDGPSWESVKWDDERLVRGQSALTKARQCLGA